MEREAYVLTHFEQAVREGWIRVYYQPVVRSYTRRICGAEALARWIDPVEGNLAPGEFIPVLEKNLMMHRLDLCICEQIAKDIALCRQQNIPLIPVSINFSGKDFYETDMFTEVERILSSYGIHRDIIHIEIIEQGEKRRDQVIDEAIDRFQKAGYEIWLDNFGKGSSFEALERYPYSTVKLDARFLLDAKDHGTWERAVTMFSYTANMSKHMGISALAENVETEEQFRVLKDMGVEMVQGYLFCKPIPLEQFLEQQDIFEAIEEAGYYKMIGQIEVNPGGVTLRRDGRDIKEPLSIMEFRDRRFFYLYQNEANREYMRNLGLMSEVATENYLNQRSGMFQEKIRDFVRRMIAGEQRVHLDFVTSGKVVDLWGDYIATNPRTGGIAMIVRKENLMDSNSTGRLQKFEVALRNIYRIFDRLDLVRKSDGLILNTYLNTSEYGALHEGQNVRDVMALFAAKYIADDQREDFIGFVDLSTLDDRLGTEDAEYIALHFDTRMDDGRYIKKKYIIQRVTEERQEMVLFAICQADREHREQAASLMERYSNGGAMILSSNHFIDQATGFYDRSGLAHAMLPYQDAYQLWEQDFVVAEVTLKHFKEFREKYGIGAAKLLEVECATKVRNTLMQGDSGVIVGDGRFLLFHPNIGNMTQEQALQTLYDGLATINVAAGYPVDSEADICFAKYSALDAKQRLLIYEGSTPLREIIGRRGESL
ncbi:MAG: EAL domain-containing protein [Lachnospiraceae bacterium]|nr:EAL domain-containing protein [Lachnospiraceae bacterium]